MFEQNSQDIQGVIENYFHGIFYGDTVKLASAFHPDCVLYGDINGEPYVKTLTAYLQGVKNRKSPSELGETFSMQLIGIELLGNNAMVKLHVPMLGFNYYDLLSLTKINGKWLIVNKLFTNIPVVR